ncbi:nucleolar protein 53 [Dioscorea alata]|uniref:Nucleolar protein 53 n=2 Tax=Dioscorea alata TaxID=55571 RepID=A0ACB7VWX6_DIOAL|nr:nucleolar protein 53 [Dioscorea alata]
MGKAAKGSRKGKKAWRANISTADIEDYFDNTTKEALAGVSAPPQSLFYENKSDDLPPKRKIEKKREKVLNYELILQKNEFVQPVPSSTLKRSLKRKKEKACVDKSQALVTSKVDEGLNSENLDLWSEKDEINGKIKKNVASHIPAVEVEPPGCSFNPPFEAHQDSLAQAVAVEMQKIYKRELQPEPVPLIVTGEVLEEEDRYFLDADDGNENDVDEDADNTADELNAQRKSIVKRVTRVELNRRARRKEQLRTEAEAKKINHVHKEIDCLSDIIEEIAKEDEEKNRRHVRRKVARQERLKSGPPRLGKLKFEPAPPQVLLTEEISGSLRKLKGCCNLSRDRFKSIQKRGLLAPYKIKKRR